MVCLHRQYFSHVKNSHQNSSSRNEVNWHRQGGEKKVTMELKISFQVSLSVQSLLSGLLTPLLPLLCATKLYLQFEGITTAALRHCNNSSVHIWDGGHRQRPATSNWNSHPWSERSDCRTYQLLPPPSWHFTTPLSQEVAFSIPVMAGVHPFILRWLYSATKALSVN